MVDSRLMVSRSKSIGPRVLERTSSTEVESWDEGALRRHARNKRWTRGRWTRTTSYEEEEAEEEATLVSPVSGKPSPRDATSLTPLTGDWHVQTPAADTSPVPAHSLPLPLPFPVPTDVGQVVVPLFEGVASTSGTPRTPACTFVSWQVPRGLVVRGTTGSLLPDPRAG